MTKTSASLQKARPQIFPDGYIETPWRRLIGKKEAYHFMNRHVASVASYLMQAYRILQPDYDARLEQLCDMCAAEYVDLTSLEVQKTQRKLFNIPDNIQGGYAYGVICDAGDETVGMAGRVTEFNQDRVEKEIDACPYSFIGTELCKSLMMMPQVGADRWSTADDKYTALLPEAIGAGHLHCRVVWERKSKHKNPDYAMTDLMHVGQVPVTITPEENCITESRAISHDEPFKSAFGVELDFDSLYRAGNMANTRWNGERFVRAMRKVEPDKHKRMHVIRMVCQAAGKASFAEFSAIEGLRQWLNVPRDVNDGRIIGAYDRVIRDALLHKSIDVEFTSERVVRNIDRHDLIAHSGKEGEHPEFIAAYEALYDGMAKTLLGPRWKVSMLEDPGNKDVCLVIEKKVDSLQ